MTCVSKYESNFGAVRLQRHAPLVPTGKKRTAWGNIYGTNDVGSTTISTLTSGIALGLLSSPDFGLILPPFPLLQLGGLLHVPYFRQPTLVLGFVLVLN